jgi:hypothetical protein
MSWIKYGIVAAVGYYLGQPQGRKQLQQTAPGRAPALPGPGPRCGAEPTHRVHRRLAVLIRCDRHTKINVRLRGGDDGMSVAA